MARSLQSLILLSVALAAFAQQNVPAGGQFAYTHSVNQQRTDKGISTEFHSTVNDRYDAAPHQQQQLQQQQQTQYVNEQVVGTDAFSRSVVNQQQQQPQYQQFGVPQEQQQQYRQQ